MLLTVGVADKISQIVGCGEQGLVVRVVDDASKPFSCCVAVKIFHSQPGDFRAFRREYEALTAIAAGEGSGSKYIEHFTHTR